MVLFPNAKINLGLDILRKRPDGYHDIETVMIPVAWYDILEIVPAKGEETTLTITGENVVDCPPEDNLVMKAYRLLDNEVGLPNVDIYLRKVIPFGAGLGGGSADAAFMLKGLNDLFSLGFTDKELAERAAALGADCPFFIYNRPMLCTGTGTEMSAIDINLKGYHILIVKPEISVPTGKAYSHTTPSIPAIQISTIVRKPVDEWNGVLKNDFEPSVFPEYPGISAIKDKIISLGAEYASMSGSGSSVYGIFKGDILADDLSEIFPDCQIFLSEL